MCGVVASHLVLVRAPRPSSSPRLLLLEPCLFPKSGARTGAATRPIKHRQRTRPRPRHCWNRQSWLTKRQTQEIIPRNTISPSFILSFFIYLFLSSKMRVVALSQLTELPARFQLQHTLDAATGFPIWALYILTLWILSHYRSSQRYTNHAFDYLLGLKGVS